MKSNVFTTKRFDLVFPKGSVISTEPTGLKNQVHEVHLYALPAVAEIVRKGQGAGKVVSVNGISVDNQFIINEPGDYRITLHMVNKKDDWTRKFFIKFVG